ncbi:DUF945 family protein [Halomonas sp. GXIMD04776]|uniref:DUF945 family protein n=1 Tax=Halomonas sp. GXIMD04776 TaxID=3415605 RepID=UPI003CBE3565
MRKVWFAVATVVVLGAGYLGAQAYSSHVFERELSRTLEHARANPQWQVTRDEVERGWFHSRGRLQLSHIDNAQWRLSLPYDARHGLLSTRISGALQGYRHEASNTSGEGRNDSVESPVQGRTALFGDILDSAEPRWVTTLHTLDRRAKGRLDIPSFTLSREEGQLSSEGAEFTLDGHVSDISIKGSIAPLKLRSEAAKIVTGPLSIDSRYQVADGGKSLFQHSELSLDRLHYTNRQQAPITLLGLSYEGDSRLDDQLTINASIALDEARVAGEAMLSGRLDVRLDRLNGNAVRRLQSQSAQLIEEQGGDFWSLSDAQRKTLIRRLESSLLATLVDSPRFNLEGITLQSALFGVDVRGHGELIFEGDDSQALDIEALLNGNAQAWREHLNGGFSWQGVPPLVALQLGLPPGTRQVDMQIERGNVLVNGRPLPPSL